MTEWNDDRLDELHVRVKDGFAKVDREMKDEFAKVDKRFEKVDERFIRLEGEMKEDFGNVHAQFVKMGERMEVGFERINDRIDRLYGVLIVTAVGVIGTLLANGIWD